MRAWHAVDIHLMIDGKMLKFAVDSGAVGTVASLKELSMCERKVSNTSQQGLSYMAAGGMQIPKG